MSKAYKVVAKMIPTGDRKGETVYTVRPVSYGLLSTEEVARQISTECTATPADVKAVLDRYAYYVKENLKKGYDVELHGFGTLTIRFVTLHSVDDPKFATGKLVSGLLPAFRPSYSMHNGARIYNLIPEKVTLVKYGEDATDGSTSEPTDSSNPDKEPSTDPDNGGGSTPEPSDPDTGGSGSDAGEGEGGGLGA